MTKENKRHTFKKNDIIESIIRMRLEGHKARTTIMRWLIKELGYSQSYSYELIRDAAKEFEQRAVINFGEDLKEDIERFEIMYEKAMKANNMKEARECLKEISKLKGHYKERVELSGSVDTTIKVIKLIGPDGTDA